VARESSLWKNLKDAGRGIRAMGHKIDMQRLENAVGVGHPDVDCCLCRIDRSGKHEAHAQQIWIELKSVERPAKPTTVVRPKLRPSQEIWHMERSAAGFRHNWVLMQVGDGIHASLYLIPGVDYTDLTSTEADLTEMSFCLPTDDLCTILLKARNGW